MTKVEQQAAQRVSEIINRLAQSDPTWGKYISRQPRYRYFPARGSRHEYFWTTEPVNHQGRPRYASGIYRFVKSKQHYKLTNAKYHARRRDAKARALQLWEANS